MPFSRAVKPFLPTATLPLFRAVDKIGQFSRSTKKIPEYCPPFYKKNGTFALIYTR